MKKGCQNNSLWYLFLYAVQYQRFIYMKFCDRLLATALFLIVLLLGLNILPAVAKANIPITTATIRTLSAVNFFSLILIFLSPFLNLIKTNFLFIHLILRVSLKYDSAGAKFMQHFFVVIFFHRFNIT